MADISSATAASSADAGDATSREEPHSSEAGTDRVASLLETPSGDSTGPQQSTSGTAAVHTADSACPAGTTAHVNASEDDPKVAADLGECQSTDGQAQHTQQHLGSGDQSAGVLSHQSATNNYGDAQEQEHVREKEHAQQYHDQQLPLEQASWETNEEHECRQEPPLHQEQQQRSQEMQQQQQQQEEEQQLQQEQELQERQQQEQQHQEPEQLQQQHQSNHGSHPGPTLVSPPPHAAGQASPSHSQQPSPAASPQGGQQGADAQVSELRQQLGQAMRARAQAEAAMAEAQQGAVDSERSLRQYYEARLRDKEQEAQQLHARMQLLEAQGPRARLKAAPRGKEAAAQLSDDELALLRREMEEQEGLLRAYQAENEAATKRIKELEAALSQARGALAQQAARAERQVAALQEGNVHSGADAAERLHRVLDLERGLAQVREEAAVREQELSDQVERLRREKQQAEARLSGVDLQQMQEGDALVRQVHSEMDAMRSTHAGIVQALQAKLQWYADNQRLLDENDALVAQQAETIRRLEAALAAAGGPAGRAATARVKELEAQVETLQQALASRHPTSLPALLAASRPSAGESARVAELQRQVDALEDRLRLAGQEHDHSLRALQQQYEALKGRYEAGLAQQERLQASTKGRSKAKELERQLEDLRALHSKKVRTLEAKVLQLQGAASRRGSDAATSSDPSSTHHAATAAGRRSDTPEHGSSDRAVALAGDRGGAKAMAGGMRVVAINAGQLREKEGEVRALRGQLQERERDFAELQQRLLAAQRQLQHHPASNSLMGVPSGHTDDSMHAAEAQQWRHKCQDLEAEVAELHAALAEAQAMVGEEYQQEILVEVEQLQRQTAAAEAEAAAAQLAAEQAEARLASAAAEHQEALQAAYEAAAEQEAAHWGQQLQALEQALRSAQSNAAELQQQLHVAAERHSHWSPCTREFAALELRVAEAEAAAAERELQWRQVLQDVKKLSSVQAEVQRRQWELALQAKNNEIEGFRSQVDALLAAARALQLQRQLQAAGTAMQLEPASC